MGKTVTQLLLLPVVGVGVLVWGARSLFSGPSPHEPAATPPVSSALVLDSGAAPAPSELNATSIQVPRVGEPIVINAEMEGKKVWESDQGSTGNFKEESGQGMVPYTDMKVRWGAGNLYLRLYAGDLDLEGKTKESDGDLRGDDAFHIEIGRGDRVHVIDVSVLGTVSDALCKGPFSWPGKRAPEACDPRWQSRAVVAIDVDGTLNHIHDNDEEWVVEMAIPLDALDLGGAGPGTRVPFSIRRCDVGQDKMHACGSWSTGPVAGELVLDP